MAGSIVKSGDRVCARVGLPIPFRMPAPSLLVATLSTGLLAGAGLFAGCGGGSSTATGTAAVPSSPATSTQAAASSADTVAVVAGVSIPKASYEHWSTVERKLGGPSNAGHRALGFLLTSQWVLDEAKARGISVSEAEVKQHFSQLVHQSFPKPGSLQKYLSTAGETEADLLVRIKVELLAAKIAAQVTAGKSASQHSAVLIAFEHNFHTHWKALTICKSGYVMEDCKQYVGKPEDLNASASSARASSSSAGSSTSGSAASSASGEVYTAPGAFSLTSSAFERNGALAAQYLCTGAGVSPPLSWTKVPAKAAELFLFVIAEGPGGSSGGGIRWVVGGIDPSSSGVAAGKLPRGGIVGTNTLGKAIYSPVCPPKGKTETVEFVMYALSKRLPLSTGFQPTKAESEYGSKKLVLGQAAVTYATATGG